MIKVPLLSRVKDIFKGSSAAKRKKVYHNVKLDNPEEYWEIIGELGDGAYGKVFKAQHKHSDKLAALKQVALEGDDDLESFMIEIDILAECKHPNIVELLEAYYFDGKLWMYLEYCDGGAVDSIMVDLDRGLTEEQVAYICKNLCHALSYIHSQKIIHRDLKAGNVLLTMDGGVKLADFGVSAKNKNTWDKRGTFIGTPYWLAPEVILCETFIDAKYDYKADIWSLGISLIEFAQMDPPNHEISPVRVMLKIQKSDPPKLDYPHKWSKEFNDFIAKCLVKDPQHRPDSEELLKHPFLQRNINLKSIRDLILEYKAEVVEEEVDDDSEETEPSRNSEACNNILYEHANSQDGKESLVSTDKDKSHLVDDRDKLPSSTSESPKESVTSVSSEKRISKKPAPLPPISTTPSQQSPKKGPAPAVPLSSSTNVDNSVVSPASSENISSSDNVDLPAKSVPGSADVGLISMTSNLADNASTSSSPEVTVIPRSKPANAEEQQPLNEPLPIVLKDCDVVEIKPDSSDSKFINEGDQGIHSSESNESFLHVVGVTVNHIEVKNESETLSKNDTSGNIEINLSNSEYCDGKINVPSLEISVGSTPSNTSQNISINNSSFNIDFSSIPVPVTFNVLSPEKSFDTLSYSAAISPEPSEVVLASISSEGTVIVRTPTPTPSEKSHPSPKAENVVTYTVAEESGTRMQSETVKEATDENKDSLDAYSMEDAEAQAVHILETAIDSAIDGSFKYTDDTSGHSSPSSLTENLEDMGNIIVNASEESVTEDLPEDSAHKLDESEVLISNFSILQDENVVSEKHSRFELTLEEGEADITINKEAETHISVVSVEEGNDSKGYQPKNKHEEVLVDGKQMSLTIEGTTVEDTDVDDLESSNSNFKMPEDLSDTAANDNESTIELSTEVSQLEEDKPKKGVEILKNPRSEDLEPIPFKVIQNEIRRRNSRSSEISDTDTTSTMGSDKENRHRHEDNEISEDVMLRKPIKITPPSVDPNAAAKNLKNKELQESIALRKKTRKRTRKFVIDGVVFTTTTSKVIYGDDEESGTLSSAHLARRQEMRELKIIQRQEQKQFQELGVKANLSKQEQERKFEIEKMNLIRNYDSQIENLTRQQKQLVEKAEARQEYELKVESKKVRSEQERELKAFRESLKQEWKLLKQESESLPKDRRKESFKILKEQLERSQAEKEKAFVERLNDIHELTLKKLSEKHRRHIALKERQFLEEKHQLLRARESAQWDTEERQIQDKHQLAKEQLKDIYFLQRYQMAIRHNVEQEQVKRLNLQKEDNLLKRHQTEKRQLPKRIRQEMKTREKMFREQIRISMTILPSHEEEKEQLKRFHEQEKIKYDKERKRAELKHKKQLEELQASTEASIRELVHLQNEKGKLLTEHETYKLKSLDEEYQKELKEWKANLAPRKQKLEEGFERQLAEQEKFYGDYLDRGLGLTVTLSESASSLSGSNNSQRKNK